MPVAHGSTAIAMAQSNSATFQPSSTAQIQPVLRQRQKRQQVARACDECRSYRIRCDNGLTCSNCKAKGRVCSNSTGDKTTTLAEAHRAIDRLSQKLKELEAELERERKRNEIGQPVQQPSPTISRTHSSPSSLTVESCYRAPSKKHWGGIQIQPPRLPHITWFGPSSLYYFISRLSAFLDSTYEQNHTTGALLPQSINSLFDDSAISLQKMSQPNTFSYPEFSTAGRYLNPIQEEYFISLYWHSFHTSIYAVIDETEFKTHYQSLWISSTNTRKPSALVDIIIAMCMQYGILSMPPNHQNSILAEDDATLAGRWHFRRGQILLACEMESPTIATLQCHLLCTIYLCGGSFHNMVDSACGSAVRTAYQLGLHLDPPDTMPEKERQMRRRLWWSTYLVDSKVGMKFGRPFLIDNAYSMPELPEDSLEAAMVSGSVFAPIGENATWLSFNLHLVKLYSAAREVHTSIFDSELGLEVGLAVWDDPQALEALAKTLYTSRERLDKWMRGVPNALKTRRKDGSFEFTTDGCSIEIEQFAPLWLQRQRVLLELAYHHLSVCLYRPIISFKSAPPPGSITESSLKICASHAVQLSKICHQVVSSTSILNGWHEVFQWQWGSAMVLVGLILVPPQGSSTLEERRALDLAVAVFDFFGTNFTTAASAATIMRTVCSKLDFLTSKAWGCRENFEGPTASSAIQQTAEHLQAPGKLAENFLEDIASYQGFDEAMDFDLFDMVVGVDFWADLDTLWPTPGHPV